MTDQEKREKVIKGLECRLDINGNKYKHCLACDYRHDIDHCQWACQTDGILEDALALLKAQEPITGETSDDTVARLIDANNVISVCEILSEKGSDPHYWNQLISIIEDMPTIDAIPVEWFTEMIKACGMQGQIGAVAAMNWVLDEWKATKDEWQKKQEAKHERPDTPEDQS